jgi:transcriptional regulator with XRE-family HTH domain
MDEVNFKTQVAEQLKLLRKQKKLSLDATAKLTGVSKAMLGQIERQVSSPTISTLWKIASGLETSFSAFFADSSAFCASETVFPDDTHMKIKTLFPFSSDVSFEMFEITLTDHHEQLSSPHSQGIIEHVHVLEGQLALYFDGVWHSFNKGESTRIFTDQPHGYKAVSETAVFQNIICYPK